MAIVAGDANSPDWIGIDPSFWLDWIGGGGSNSGGSQQSTPPITNTNSGSGTPGATVGQPIGATYTSNPPLTVGSNTVTTTTGATVGQSDGSGDTGDPPLTVGSNTVTTTGGGTPAGTSSGGGSASLAVFGRGGGVDNATLPRQPSLVARTFDLSSEPRTRSSQLWSGGFSGEGGDDGD